MNLDETICGRKFHVIAGGTQIKLSQNSCSISGNHPLDLQSNLKRKEGYCEGAFEAFLTSL